MHICDIPGFVTRHAKKRKDNMFNPYDGRFCPDSQENFVLAKANALEVSIPELNTRRYLYNEVRMDHSYSDRTQSRTGLANHYCAFDREVRMIDFIRFFLPFSNDI